MYGCSAKKSKSAIYYVINHQEKIELPREDSLPPPPILPSPFYGNYNFILLDSSHIFIHKKHKNYRCGNEFDYGKPFRLFLSPEDIREVKIENLEQFLKSIPDSIISDRHFYASISSPVDTIRNPAYKKISDFLKSKNIRFYNTRNCTEEEYYALTAKLENRKFDQKTVEWKIGFGDMPYFLAPSDSLK